MPKRRRPTLRALAFTGALAVYPATVRIWLGVVIAVAIAPIELAAERIYDQHREEFEK